MLQLTFVRCYRLRQADSRPACAGLTLGLIGRHHAIEEAALPSLTGVADLRCASDQVFCSTPVVAL